jgi:hypothetical protein
LGEADSAVSALVTFQMRSAPTDAFGHKFSFLDWRFRSFALFSERAAQSERLG